MIFIIEFKKYMINAYIFSIVVIKFSYLKEIYLVILFKIEKILKKSFYCIILSLSLIINLKIKDSKMLLFDI